MENLNVQAVEVDGLVDMVGAPVMRAGFSTYAAPSWITLSAASGTGNSTVDVTVPKWQGRNGRSGSFTVKVAELTEEVSVSQKGSTIWDVTTKTLAFAKGGETKKFTGNANLASVTFSVASGGTWLTAGKITVASKEYASGATITGDPGASAPYAFEIPLTAAANGTVSSRSTTFTANGQSYTMTQAAGDATLTVSPTALEFEAAGGTKQITITTNTAWTIE